MLTDTHVHVLLHYYYNRFTAPWSLSGTTWVSQNQKGKTRKVKPISGFTGATDSEWQWRQLGNMQICTSPQTDNHNSISPLNFFTDRMPFLLPIQQRRSTEDTYVLTDAYVHSYVLSHTYILHCSLCSIILYMYILYNIYCPKTE